MASTHLENHGRTSFHSHARSEAVCVEIYLFPCGHGDTILLKFPGHRWVLIDCYLPDNGTRDAFFEFVDAQQVTRLEWIFQTHPDFDHFFGMTEVLDYFTREGRSIGCWCDSGLTVAQIKDIIKWGSVSESHYEILQDRLDELDDMSLIQFSEINESVQPVSPEGFTGKIEIQPIGPSAWLKRRTARKDLARFRDNPVARPEANDISVVLLLLLRDQDKGCSMLLPGDAGSDVLSDALNVWHERMGTVSGSHAFDVIKVPHHGSKASHSTNLCKAKLSSPSKRVAAISAGTRDALPDREVLKEYMSEGWTVMATTTRPRPARADSPLSLSNRNRRKDAAMKQHLVRISWSASGGLTFQPPEATLLEIDLPMYKTVGK